MDRKRILTLTLAVGLLLTPLAGPGWATRASIIYVNAQAADADDGASYSLVQRGCPSGSTCDHILTTNPEFLDANGADNVSGAPDDDLRLKPDSPAIDAGDKSAVPSSVDGDLEGRERFFDVTSVPDTGSGSAPIVDMGAYEAA